MAPLLPSRTVSDDESLASELALDLSALTDKASEMTLSGLDLSGFEPIQSDGDVSYLPVEVGSQMHPTALSALNDKTSEITLSGLDLSHFDPQCSGDTDTLMTSHLPADIGSQMQPAKAKLGELNDKASEMSLSGLDMSHFELQGSNDCIPAQNQPKKDSTRTPVVADLQSTVPAVAASMHSAKLERADLWLSSFEPESIDSEVS